VLLLKFYQFPQGCLRGCRGKLRFIVCEFALNVTENAMATYSAYDQLLLELVNRARMDPLGEAARLGIDLNAGLAAGTISATPKQPLAPNNNLVTAARAHSQFMVDTDQFNHAGIGDGTPTSRMQAAGYTLTGSWATGENIAWVGTTGTVNLLASTLSIADNLFRSAGHRVNSLNDNFRELGTGVVEGPFKAGAYTYNAVMATENFGLSGGKIFVSGVAINDLDGDNFYDIGEARGDISVSVSTLDVLDGTDITEAAGGYGIGVRAGSHVVTFSGGDLAAPVGVTVTAASANVKVDLAGAGEILSSVTAALGSGAKDITLLGASAINGTGNADNNVLTGNRAANVLSGGDGNDTLIGGGGLDTLVGGTGIDTLIGGAGWDKLTGGADSDQFKFDAFAHIGLGFTRDVVTDFQLGIDKIDLSVIDANGALAGSTAFLWRGTTGFSGVAGQLAYRIVDAAGTVDDKTVIDGDINGDRVADFQIQLNGLIKLAVTDFVL
jgi:Ca2+-binding RTX toxin-like protein